MLRGVKDALRIALLAGVLLLPLAGVHTGDAASGTAFEWRWLDVAVAAALVFAGRLGLLARDGSLLPVIGLLGIITGTISFYITWPTEFLRCAAIGGSYALALRALWLWLRKHPVRWGQRLQQRLSHFRKRVTDFNTIGLLLFVFVLVMPFLPFSSRYLLDVGIMVMTYIVLAWGLNITVGYAGLLDLGYAGFYAIGAYGYALMAQYWGLNFWMALPTVAVIAVVVALLLGIPVLRLRGDYFAVVTLGFGEITRLVLINWTTLTHGPNGISGIPRPTLFNLEFARQAADGMRPFHEWLGVEFSPMQRVMFLYYIILLMAVGVGYVVVRLRHLPLGCAWEAFREDEIACASLGIDRPRIKLAAYVLSAMVAAMAGAFFATRQGFVSPESFTFNESATILAIVILGGIGHPVGIVLAALFIIGMPELFRGLDQYRMLAFGAGMVLIMIWRPGGLASERQPIVTLAPDETVP